MRVVAVTRALVRNQRHVPRHRFIIDPSSPQRIAFDLMAMIFLLYDLCLTPVTIAWDFPMVGWLLQLARIGLSGQIIVNWEQRGVLLNPISRIFLVALVFVTNEYQTWIESLTFDDSCLCTSEYVVTAWYASQVLHVSCGRVLDDGHGNDQPDSILPRRQGANYVCSRGPKSIPTMRLIFGRTLYTSNANFRSYSLLCDRLGACLVPQMLCRDVWRR